MLSFLMPIIFEIVATLAIVVAMFYYLGIASQTFKTLVAISLWLIGVTYSSAIVMFISSHYEDRIIRGIFELVIIFIGPLAPYFILSWILSFFDIRNKKNAQDFQYIKRKIELYPEEVKEEIANSFIYLFNKNQIDKAFKRFLKTK